MFTFKTNWPTGRYRSFSNPTHEIKLKRKMVGLIDADPPHQIRLMVMKDDIMEDGNPNCEWMWIVLSQKFSCVNDAKDYLRMTYEAITTQLKLRLLDS